MPFIINNSGIESGGRCGVPRHNNNGEEDRDDDLSCHVAFRSRTEFAYKEPCRQRRDIRTCGRDAVINKPYRPIGSMQSVLGLEVMRPGKGLVTTNPQKHRGRTILENDHITSPSGGTMLSEPGSDKTKKPNNKKKRNKGQNEIDEEDDDLKVRDETELTLGQRLWNLRHSQSKIYRGIHSQGYKEIMQNLKVGSQRIKMIKAGGSCYNTFSRTDPIECAKWGVVQEEKRMVGANVAIARSVDDDDEQLAIHRGSIIKRNSERTIINQSKDSQSRSSAIVVASPTSNADGGRGPSLMDKGDGSKEPGSLKTTDRLAQEFDLILYRDRPKPQKEASMKVRKRGGNGRRHSRPGGNRLSIRFKADDIANSRGQPRSSVVSVMGRKSLSEDPDNDGKEDDLRLPKELLANSKPLDEAQRKRLPSYVINFPRKSMFGINPALKQEKMKNQLAEIMAIQQEDKERKRLERFEREHQRTLERMDAVTKASEAARDGVLKQGTEFCHLKSKMHDQLADQIGLFEFERANEYRRKFVALDFTLNQHVYTNRPESTDQFDIQKDLQLMRKTTQELRSVQIQHNMANSQWYKTLVKKCKETNQELTAPERKFLAALRQLIQEGWTFTPEIFKMLLLDVVDRKDHKLVPMQRLFSLIRDQVLKIDLNEYHEFLRENKLYIPKSLIDRIEETTTKKQNRFSGLRAAAYAMKWKRATLAKAFIT